jgi:hypothetical protein
MPGHDAWRYRVITSAKFFSSLQHAARPLATPTPVNGITVLMKLGFEETQTPYTSGSQSARAWTEQWVHNQVYCPNCGSAKIDIFPNNSPVADFFAQIARKNTSLKARRSHSATRYLTAHSEPNVNVSQPTTIQVSFF